MASKASMHTSATLKTLETPLRRDLSQKFGWVIMLTMDAGKTRARNH